MRPLSFDAKQTPNAANDDHPCDGTCFPGCDQINDEDVADSVLQMIFEDQLMVDEEPEGPTRAEDKVALGSILLSLSKATEVFASKVAEDE